MLLMVVLLATSPTTSRNQMTKSYLTPIDDNYATCERTKAVLRIYCGDASPSSITSLLSIQPTSIVELGVPQVRRGGKHGPIGKINLWMLDSEGAIQSKDLRRHLDWILDILAPVSAQILSLRQSGICMDLNCVWWSQSGEGGPALWPDQMRRIAALDLELSIGFSYYGDDD